MTEPQQTAMLGLPRLGQSCQPSKNDNSEDTCGTAQKPVCDSLATHIRKAGFCSRGPLL